MLVLCDACPIIFLGKINQLNLIKKLFPGEILLPSIVKSELFTPLLAPEEEKVLTLFAEQCTIIEIKQTIFTSKTLSNTDKLILTYAMQNKVDVLLSDDRLVRRVAMSERVRPVGTLGILIQAMKKGLITIKTTRELVEELIHKYKFRISIEVFESVIKVIDEYRHKAGK
jgi:predicted nucleic acid-binding protein